MDVMCIDCILLMIEDLCVKGVKVVLMMYMGWLKGKVDV